jgi:Fe2+ or Zn2+ uptake regulation protein
MSERTTTPLHTRNTVQRKLVLKTVRDFKGHPSADDVYHLARKVDPKISRGTVYRNLNILAQQGELRQMPMPAGPIRYDAILTPHYHFCCHDCSETINAELPYNESLNQADVGMDGYITEWHRLVLVGLCQRCSTRHNHKNNC